MERQDLERMSREQLIAQAEKLGIPRPRVLTQPELIDEIIRATTQGERERAKARGWLGRARDLLTKVVERGLHLPEAARALRKDGDDKGWPTPPPPLPTVTLAEIYAAQGHLERALAVLDEVLAREPDHREAKAMRERFAEQHHRARSRAGHKEPPPPEKMENTPPEKKKEPASMKQEAAPPKKETAPLKKDEPAPPTMKATVVEAPAASPPPAAPAVRAPAAPAHVAAPTASPPIAMLRTEPLSDVESASTERAPSILQPAAEAPATAAPVPPAAAAKAAALDEPPLPERYEVDEIVAIAVDPRTLYFYWEVRPTTLAHAQARHPEGWLAIRVASVIASWEGPSVDMRDLRVDALYGDRFLRDVKPGSNVRVSVGWRTGADAEGFEPFAVGSEVTLPRAVPVETVAQEVARWEADPVVAPFQHRVEAPALFAMPAVRNQPVMQVRAPATATTAAFVERTRSVAATRGGPVDTGVALWGPAPRAGDTARHPGGETHLVPYLAYPGASELSYYPAGGEIAPPGASDLSTR